MPRQDDDGGAERDAPRASREIAEELRRRGRHRVAREVVLEGEERVEAERLGEIAECQMLGEDVGVRAAFLLQHVERDSDLHGVLRLCFPTFASARCPSRVDRASAVAFTSFGSVRRRGRTRSVGPPMAQAPATRP